MNYVTTDEIKKKNYKGLLSTDENNRVLRPKMAFNAVRNLVSVFDNLGMACDSSAVKISADSAMVYCFADEATGRNSIVLWKCGATPDDCLTTAPVTVEISGLRYRRPVCVDLLSGRIHRLHVRKCEGRCILDNVPFYDSPVVICERTSIHILAL